MTCERIYKELKKRFKKVVLAFIFFYKQAQEAYENVKELNIIYAFGFFLLFVWVAYDEWKKRGDEDELEALRRDKYYADIGKLFVKGKLPSSSLLNKVQFDKEKCFSHITIYAVVNGNSNFIEDGKLFWNKNKCDEAKGKCYNKKVGYIHNDDWGKCFETEDADNNNLYETIQNAEKFIKEGGVSEERREARENNELSSRQKYQLNKYANKLRKEGYSVVKKKRAKTPKRK